MSALLTLALLALLWLLGVGVEAAWDWWRYAEMAAECKSVPYYFELAYAVAREAFEETKPKPLLRFIPLTARVLTISRWPWSSAKECLEFYEAREAHRP